MLAFGRIMLMFLAALPAAAQVMEIKAVGDLPTAPAAAFGADDLDALHREVRTRISQTLLPVPQGGLPRASNAIADVWLALAAVQAEKARDFAAANQPEAAATAAQAARDLLAVKDPTALPAAIRHGRLLELAYLSDNDASPQPYFLYVPSTYKPGNPLPLILFLHGYVPDTSRINPYLVSDFVMDMAEKQQVLLAIPHGRTNTDFQYVGEVDVLRVKAEMEKFFTVDPERVSILGVSMGGAGAWQIAAHYPDQFAGTAPINGQADWFRFWHEKFNYPARPELPPHIESLIALNSPLELADNFCNTYSYSQHAIKCFVGVKHTRDMVARLKAIGAPYETMEDPSNLGHYIYWQPECWDRAFRHLLAQKRRAVPTAFRYATWTLRYPGAWWARITRIATYGRPASFAVIANGAKTGMIDVKAENVTTLALTPAADWAAADGSYTVTFNGAKLAPAKPDARGVLTLNTPGLPVPAAAPLRKNSQVCGPVSDVFNFPFVAVRGTAGSEAETAALAVLADQFVADWKGYAEGNLAVLKDTDVTEDIIRDRSLVLFGLPETNTLVKRMAKALPLQLSREAVTLPDGKVFKNENTGLVMTCPNPLNPERYVLIFNGLHGGEGRSANHRFDRFPDFSIFTRDSLPGIGVNRFLAAGFFDSAWHYDPKLTDFAAPPPAAPPVPHE